MKYKDSQILREVHRMISRSEQGLICYALQNCRIGTVIQRKALRWWVMRMLGGFSSYNAWVANHHPRKWRRMQSLVWKNGIRTKNDPFREGRLAWLDWMIAECEKEEAK